MEPEMLEPDRPASSPSQAAGGADEGGEDGDGDAALASEREEQELVDPLHEVVEPEDIGEEPEASSSRNLGSGFGTRQRGGGDGSRLNSAGSTESDKVTISANVRLCRVDPGQVADLTQDPEEGEVLELPIVRLSAARKRLMKAKRKLALIGGFKTQDILLDTLEGYKTQVGKYFGVDPTVWELQDGDQKDVKEENGYIVTKVTGMYLGVDLRLFLVNPYYDPRLKHTDQEEKAPVVQSDDPNAAMIPADESFDYTHYHVHTWEIKTDRLWQSIVDDQPWSPTVLRQNCMSLLYAKMVYSGPGNAHKIATMRLEAIHGIWELVVNRRKHHDISFEILERLVSLLNSTTNVEESMLAAIVVWHLASSQTSRRTLAHCGMVASLLNTLKWTLKTQVVPKGQRRKLEKGQMKEMDREKLQYRALAGLAVCVVDRVCREELMKAEVSLKTLFALAGELEDYDEVYANQRRLLAVQVIANTLIRDAAFRLAIIPSGGVLKVLDWLMQPSPQLSVGFMQCGGAVIQHYGGDQASLKKILECQQLGKLMDALLAALDKMMLTFETRTRMGIDEMMMRMCNLESVAFGLWGAAFCASAASSAVREDASERLGLLAVRSKRLDGKFFKGNVISLNTTAASYQITSIISSFAIDMTTAPTLMYVLPENQGTLNGSAIDSLATMIDPDPLPGSSCQNYDEEGRIRAAGLSAIALITAHPFGQTGDECMVGYFRKPVLAHGVLGTVLRCMQAPSMNQAAGDIIGECGAVAIMNLSTMVTDECEPWMIDAILGFMNNSQSGKVVEHLVVAFWILLRNPRNRLMVGDVKGGKVGLAKQNLDLHEDEMAIVAMADANAEDEESDSNNSQAPVEGTTMDEGDDVLEEGDSQTEGSRRSSQISEGSRFLQDGVGNGGQDSKSSMNRNRHSRILDAKQGEVEDMGLQALLQVARKWWPKCKNASGTKTDTSIVKLYEFLIPSLWLYLIEDGLELEPRQSSVTTKDRPQGASSGSWWTTEVAINTRQNETESPQLVKDCLQVLMTVIWFNNRCHAKTVQLAVACLWNLTSRKRTAELDMMQNGLGNSLLAIMTSPTWTPSLYDKANAYLADLINDWRNMQVFGEANLERFLTSLVRNVQSRVPRLEACALRILGHFTSCAPYFCPNPAALVAFVKDTLMSQKGIQAIHGLLIRRLRVEIDGESEHVPGNQQSLEQPSKPGYVPVINPNQPVLELDPYFEVPIEHDLPPESEIGNPALLAHALRLLRNLSVRKPQQVHIAKVCMMTLLRMTTYFAQKKIDSSEANEADADITNLVSVILQNIASHPDNRTRFYKVELRGSNNSLVEDLGRAAGSIELGTESGRATTSLVRSSLPSLKRLSSPNRASTAQTLQTNRTQGGGLRPPHSAASVDSLRPKVKFPMLPVGGTAATPLGGSPNPSPRDAADAQLSKSREKRKNFFQWIQQTFTTPEAIDAVMRAQGEHDGYSKRLHPRVVLPEGELEPGAQTVAHSVFSHSDSEEDVDGPSEGSPSKASLNQKLRRPLAHLWKRVDEETRVVGQNRWCPPISEYQEDSRDRMQGRVAKKLLHTLLPPTASLQLAKATSSTGNEPAPIPSAVVPRRPETRERTNGRVAMTNLRPETMHRMRTQLQEHELHEKAKRKGKGKGKGKDKPRDAGQAQNATAEAAAAAVASQEMLSLRVAVAPQCTRHLMTFKDTVKERNFTSAKLAMFEHVKGSRVADGLYPQYYLPNGKKAHFYYTMGTMVEEVVVSLSDPPQRPNSIGAALQDALPMDIIIDQVAKPPGPHDNKLSMFKPIPPLAPLPERHTLDVRRPHVIRASAFADLKSIPLTILALVTRVVRRDTQETRVKIDVKPPTPKEPWSLPKSIFKPRTRESDAKNFWDTPKIEQAMLESDWEKMCAKDKLCNFINREGKGVRSGDVMEEMFKILEVHYQLITSSFMYYASLGSGSPYHIQLNAFTSFLEDCHIPDSESKFIKRSDCDTIFIEANFAEKAKVLAVNDGHAMMRFEYMEALIRIAAAKFGRNQVTGSLVEAFDILMSERVLPLLPRNASAQANDFRSERLYFEEVDLVFRKYERVLRAIYSRYRTSMKGGGVRLKMIGMDGWEAFAEDVGLVADDMPIQELRLCFLYSRMNCKDEVRDWIKFTTLTFIDFLEAIGRVADCKFIPSNDVLRKTGYENHFQWFNSSKFREDGDPLIISGIIPRRDSFGWSSEKTRPLHLKIDGLMDIICRKLYFDPNNPAVLYNEEKLLTLLAKLDKQMGP